MGFNSGFKGLNYFCRGHVADKKNYFSNTLLLIVAQYIQQTYHNLRMNDNDMLNIQLY